MVAEIDPVSSEWIRTYSYLNHLALVAEMAPLTNPARMIDRTLVKR